MYSDSAHTHKRVPHYLPAINAAAALMAEFIAEVVIMVLVVAGFVAIVEVAECYRIVIGLEWRKMANALFKRVNLLVVDVGVVTAQKPLLS